MNYARVCEADALAVDSSHAQLKLAAALLAPNANVALAASSPTKHLAPSPSLPTRYTAALTMSAALCDGLNGEGEARFHR